jgi:hypothetical protein
MRGDLALGKASLPSSGIIAALCPNPTSVITASVTGTMAAITATIPAGLGMTASAWLFH